MRRHPDAGDPAPVAPSEDLLHADPAWLAWAVRDFEHQVVAFRTLIELAAVWGHVPLADPSSPEEGGPGGPGAAPPR